MSDDQQRRSARDVGKATVDSVRRGVRGGLRQRLAAMLRSDPEALASAVELGLVRREWVRDPVGEPISETSPVEVVQRFLQREVERRPSLMRQWGLDALSLLTAGDGEENGVTPSKPLAIVFTDLVGFTSFTEREGDDAAQELLGRHTRAVGPVVRSRGGRIVKRLGDGVLATFPGPEAAVLAALELVANSPAPLAMRAGVHWGEVHESRDDVVGHDVNVAARVCDVARGDEVLVTAETRDAVRGLRSVEFGRAGRRKVKGLDEPVRVCRARRTEPPTLEVAVVPPEDRSQA